MRKALKTTKGSKGLAALVVVAVTVLYLGLTAAFAQTSITSTSSGTNLAYEPDYLSFGDMYAFTESVYQNSSYGLTNSQQTVSLYNNAAADQSTTANQTFYLYYGKVTTGDHSNVSNGEKMENHEYPVFNSGCAQGTAPAAVAGETVPVMTTTGTGLYTLVPGTTGTYRIYVYAESNPTGHVTYELIDSYTKANAYTGAPTQSLNFTQVGTTNYWYAQISVSELTWSAYQITAKKSDSTATSTTKDTNGGVTYTGAQEGKTTLTKDYYYNVWTATKIYYNTLLAIQFDSTVQLAPVTKLADAVTINNSDVSAGSLTAVNAFGETVTSGSATVHAPIYITATPANAEYAFSGFSGADLDLVNAEQGIYRYNFESAATLIGNWTKKEDLPTIKISGSYTGAMDFMAATSVSTEIVKGTSSNYTLTLDYTNAGDVQSVSYTVTVAGTQTASGSLSEASNTISLNAQWDTAVVTLTATSNTGKTYTAVFTVNVGTAGLVDVAQIGSTKYQFIEDALAAAVSGNTVTIIAPKVSFVDSDTVPAAWTADSNGDGYPDGYTVKSGVTLILPYSASGSTSIGSSSADYPFALCTMSATVTNSLATSESYEYRKLTVPASKTMYIKGTVATGGTISSYSGVAGGTNGSASETYSVLELNGTAEVLSGGIVTSCGYIYGSGTLNAKSGAALYQPLVICDFRAGSYTVGAAGKSYAVGTQTGESYVSPFTRFTAQNIQSRVEMSEGALMYGYCDLYTASLDKHNQTTACLVGSSSVDGLIKLSSGAKLTATYDKNDYVSAYPRVGHLDITLEGGGSFGTLSLTVTLGITATITTDELSFPIPYNFSIHLNGSGSKYTIGYSMVLLPGATLEVGEGATLDVGSSSTSFRFMAMDGYNCHIGPASGSTYTISYNTKKGNNYPTTAVLQAAGKSGTSDLIVNGTLNINSGVNFGGVVQAGSNSAVLNMDSAAKSNCSVQMGLVGNKLILTSRYYFAGATTRTLSAQIIDRGTGQRINIVAGKTYYGAEGSDIIADYTYELYTDASSTSTKESHTDSLNATVEGSWYNYTATINMVSPTTGEILSTSTAYFAHGADVSDYYTDQACTQHASTVTQNNMVLYTDNIEARVEWASGSADTYYPSLRNAVKDAVNPGDKVVLMKDITLDTTIPIDSAQNITITLKDGETAHSIAYSSTPFVNSGTVTLDLGGGTITNLTDEGYTAAEAFTNTVDGTATIDLNGGSMTGAITNNGTMTIDLNGGTLDYHTGATAASSVYNTMAAVTNNGMLTIQDTAGGGKITTDAIENSSSIQNYVSVVRNLGTLSMDGVTMSIGQTVNDYSAVVLNYNGGVINTINNSNLVCTKGYGIVNYGGTIQTISGGSINGGSADTAGRYGIMNRNIRSGSQTEASPYTVSKVGTIETISGISIYAYQYGINNYGLINAITGDTAIKTTSSYAIYNGTGWYYDTQATVATTTVSNYEKTTVYTYDTENYPTIQEISGNVTISSEGNYVFYNYGNINKISGDMAGDGVQIRRDNGQYVLINGGYIGEISGKVTIYSSSSYTLAQNLWGTGLRTVGQTYIQKDNDQNSVYTDTGDVREYQYTYAAPVIDKIGGSNSQVTISGSSTALYNYGTINTITDGVTITARTRTNAVVNGTSGGGLLTNDSVRTNLGKDSVANRYETRVEDTRTYFAAKIGSITGNVTIECPSNTGAVVNGGTIDLIGSGVTLKATGSVIQNTSYTYSETQYVYLGYNATSVFGTSGEGAQTYAFTATTPTITMIDGATIQATNGSSAVLNGGTIGTIQNSTISATGSYAINNTYNIVTQRKIYKDNTLTTEYALTELFDAFFTEDTSTGKHTSVAGSAAPNRVDTYGFTPTITTIGTGNVISAAKQTIYNMGEITTIDSGTGTKTKITSTDTGTSGQAIYNFSCLYNTNTVKDGTGTQSDYQSPGHIGTIQNVVVTGGYRALQNGDAGAYLNVIDKIGTGAEITSTGNDAVYNASKNAQITSITGGIYTASASGKYAVYNNNTSAAIPISGGDFKGGTNTDATKGRDYAIFEPDKTTRQTYPESYTLSGVGVIRDTSVGSGYYYITPNQFTIHFDGNGADSGSMADLEVSPADGNVTLTANGFSKTGTSGGSMTFKGWATASNAAEAAVVNGWSGTAAELKTALGLDVLGAGSEITIYAVWQAEDAISVTISWGAMSYSYEAPAYRWDPDKLQYVQTNPTTAGWKAEGTTTAAGLNPGEIRITNDADSTAPVTATVSFVAKTGLDWTPSLLLNDSENTLTLSSIAPGGSQTVTAKLAGVPTSTGSGVTVGTVTITLEKSTG